MHNNICIISTCCTKHNDFRLPAMPTSYGANIIINGILENRRIFSVPNHFMLPVKLVR